MLKSEVEAERQVAEEFFAQDDWKDAVVLVGPTDPLLQDLAITPFDAVPVPKVGVHGNLLKTIVSGKFLKHVPTWLNYAIVFGLTFIVTGLVVFGGSRACSLRLSRCSRRRSMSLCVSRRFPS